MDFESLTRRELQGLCKKNKIPANITNVAMIDALKALDFIEGIEELMQPSQSESAQSSVESPGKLEVTSPCVPPTGGRTTRRRNVVKEEAETLQSLTRTLRSTRKTIANDADQSKSDGTETPALMQTTRRKAPAASVCRKMESQLKECVEEKKNVLETPAPSGVTSRRRRGVKEESELKKVYSTRRSVRLAEKNVEISHEVESEKSETLKMDLGKKDCGENVQMNLKEDLDDVDETSGITGVNANTNVEDTEGNDESEVISAQEQHMEVCEEKTQATVYMETAETASNCEADDQKPEEQLCDLESEKAGFGFEIKAKLNEETLDKPEVPNVGNLVMALDVSSEIQESNGLSHDVYASEIDNAFRKSEHVNMGKSEDSEDKACDSVENVVLETEDKYAAYFPDDTEMLNETEKEMENDKNTDSDYVQDLIVNENVLEITVDPDVGMEEKEQNDDTCGAEDSTADDMSSDISLMNEEEGAKIEPNLTFFTAPSDLTHQIVKPTCLTPIKSYANKASATKNRMLSVVSDNKENIGSGSKLVLTKERVKIKNTSENATTRLDDLSVRQLTKMLKEKLEITKKLPKYENENEAQTRPALQALPENRLVDGTHN